MTAILAIESATGPCSAAVWQDGRLKAYAENTSPVMQSARLLPMVEQVLKESGLEYRDLSAVAATIGPGSFTGIRVGLAAARGICFAAGIRGLGFTTLDVLAFGAVALAGGAPVLAILNAGKGEYYYQLPGGAPRIGTLETALAAAGKNLFIAGNVPPLCLPPQAGGGKEGEGKGISFPRADILAALAATRPPALPLSPYYIRPPDAKLPSKKM
ncbi:MAG: tRNA (adenosine(37)-N6)-threonylcarbamoyltransferase complex dimerization subunit type 1 TsaB [Pseudomonadota bacterium]|nr:tRNA (adenosine(37)-N6)-threonylcarbamoyltransferase complex dimerization subunit type 1 TsaB [Pseudomonadota bacterium]MDE3038246.1 tRNA (adenosine(37)-N6)-threonylcarbamoyltransferase complex dimerization subunit type 1 TsaB [Pseudomonadota bacterium]